MATAWLLAAILATASMTASGKQLPDNGLEAVAEDVQISCNSNEIQVAVSTRSGSFNGMIYPKGLSKNSSCMAEFLKESSPVRYRLPLRSCNTMSTHTTDGGVEYFNTIVVQPHLKLVTNQGRGFHIRCRYETRDKLITNNMNVSLQASTLVSATAPMPGVAMRVLYGDRDQPQVAENVKIGDPLSLEVTLDDQSVFGLRVTDCLVRDGLGWGEQRLINSEGCPVDNEIMGPFAYDASKTRAWVSFQAHKFPYTASVYYQCNVRLCTKAGNDCDDLPPDCSTAGRKRRQIAVAGESAPATIEVYSGLYVNEANDLSKVDILDDIDREKTPNDPNSICISQRDFAIGVAIAGLVLMLLVVLAVLCLLARRRGRKDVSATDSSIYSGPYTNTAYSHTS